jgi:Transposase DDE domain
MAIDLHLRPYYGDKKTRGVFRGQAKASTKTFFAYATLLVIRRGQAFTVGLTHALNGAQEQVRVLQRLLQQAADAGLKVRRLLLDRGFYGATTIKWLQERSLPFIMPVIRRGKSGAKKADCTGTAPFFVKGRRGWQKYTWTARPVRAGKKTPGIEVTIDICMVPRSLVHCRVKPSAKKRNKAKKKTGPLVYACHATPLTLKEVGQCYRKRFQIETSYRQLGQGLAATCSKNPVYRLLLTAIALMLRNLWVWLHWLLLERTPEGNVLHLEKLRLLTIMAWLSHALGKLLGIKPQAITVCRQLTNV